MPGPRQQVLAQPVLSPFDAVGRILRTIAASRSSGRKERPSPKAVRVDPVVDRAEVRQALKTRLSPHLIRDVGGGDG